MMWAVFAVHDSELAFLHTALEAVYSWRSSSSCWIEAISVLQIDSTGDQMTAARSHPLVVHTTMTY